MTTDPLILVGDVLGVTPQVCRGHWGDLPAGTAHALARLRVDILVVEAASAHPELDDLDVDPQTEHLWIADGESAVAYVRVVRHQDGVRCLDRACARPDVRGLGLTGALVTDVIARYGADPLRAWVRPEAIAFFGRHGFEVSGPPAGRPGGSNTSMARRAEAPWRY